ncbi:MAG: FAD-binding oxidoreductase [Bacteroidia bacterium]|nr:FAD-binding oxidoreductase [Bacteroidia bacterium]MCO5254646.1 FAD-binding oxidoreductase [Bacteroidota bacterium]
MQERVLVVGQGLTGSVLSLQLRERGHRVWVVDEGRKYTSSNVAAGLFNPMVVGRLKITWNAEALFSHFSAYYARIEKQFNTKFFHPMPLIHLCKDIEEQNDWDVLAGTDKTAKWIERYTTHLPAYIQSEYGNYLVKSTGWVDLHLFLGKVRECLVAEGKFILGAPKIREDIEVIKTGFRYQGMEFDRVFLCRGEFERLQADFPKLPYNPVKGQLFDIETDFDLEQIIFHKQVFMLPTGKRTAKVGSTYTWDSLDYDTLQKDTDFLQERLDDFLQCKYRITNVKAGVRPAFHYGRPMFVEDEELSGLYVLNGMGSKGVTLAPYFAEQLLDSVYGKI